MEESDIKDYEYLIGYTKQQAKEDLLKYSAFIRFMERGYSYTCDLVRDRLNLALNEEGVVSRVFLG